MEMPSRWKWNGENSAWIDCLARGEEEEKERRESYQTWRFYHMVIPQTCDKTVPIDGLPI
jgi:phosphoenolpyruvate carboxylase